MARHGIHRNQTGTGAIDPSGYPTGSYCPPYYCANDTNLPGCGAWVKPACDVQLNPAVLRGISVDVNAGIFTLTVVPLRTNYFQPLARRDAAIDATDPDTNRRAEIHGIFINQFPQEPFSQPAAVANTAVHLNDIYEAPDGYGVPVAYGFYSIAALIHVFTMQGVAIEPAGVFTDYYTAHWGNGLDALPPGYQAGRPFHFDP